MTDWIGSIIGTVAIASAAILAVAGIVIVLMAPFMLAIAFWNWIF